MKIQTRNHDRPVLVKLGVSRQVVIPKKIHRELGIAAGDYLEVERRRNQVILTPKSFIDRELAIALEDVRKGRTYGPFNSAGEMLRDLQRRVTQYRRKKNSTKPAHEARLPSPSARVIEQLADAPRSVRQAFDQKVKFLAQNLHHPSLRRRRNSG